MKNSGKTAFFVFRLSFRGSFTHVCVCCHGVVGCFFVSVFCVYVYGTTFFSFTLFRAS